MLLMMLAGWLNRHQQDLIEYLREENKILREKLGTKRVILNDNQRMRLARLGKKLGKLIHTFLAAASAAYRTASAGDDECSFNAGKGL